VQPERHRRIRRIKFLLRHLPRRATLHRYPVLKWFAETARRRPYLWSFRTSEMTPAFYAGSILALEPVYGFQLILAFVLALVFRANLPVLVGLQFITNPATLWLYGLTYWVGDFFKGAFVPHESATAVGRAAFGLIIGGAVCGLALGLVLDLTYRFLAYEARKHHWHIPRRRPRGDSASPPPPTHPES
jgi:uncharacterized protein